MLSNQIFRGLGAAASPCRGAVQGTNTLWRGCRRGTSPPCISRGSWLPTMNLGSQGQGGGQNGQPRLGWGCSWGGAGAELPWEQGAVLRRHPELRQSESVFLLFQLKRKQERLPPPLLSACRCLALCLLSPAAALKPPVVSSRHVAPDKDGREGSGGSWLARKVLLKPTTGAVRRHLGDPKHPDLLSPLGLSS